MSLLDASTAPQLCGVVVMYTLTALAVVCIVFVIGALICLAYGEFRKSWLYEDLFKKEMAMSCKPNESCRLHRKLLKYDEQKEYPGEANCHKPLDLIHDLHNMRKK